MRILKKYFIPLMATGFLLFAMLVTAAGPAKEKNEPLEKCKLECLNVKGNAAYEGCMLNCNKTYDTKRPVAPATTKK